jgi:hypothetical protein
MAAQTPRTPPCTPGKRTRPSRSSTAAKKAVVAERTPPGASAVAVAVDTFERMAERHLLALYDVAQAQKALDAAVQVRDAMRDTRRPRRSPAVVLPQLTFSRLFSSRAR